MKTIRFALVAVPLLLAGCAHDPTAREIGAATGAVVGVVVGNALIGDTGGTLIGAGAGALLGSRVARNHGRR